jgi:hypothetical protein
LKQPINLLAVREARARLAVLAAAGVAAPDGADLESLMADLAVTLRLAPELIDRIDSWAARQREREPGRRWPRSDAFRALLLLGLEASEGPQARGSRSSAKVAAVGAALAARHIAEAEAAGDPVSPGDAHLYEHAELAAELRAAGVTDSAGAVDALRRAFEWALRPREPSEWDDIRARLVTDQLAELADDAAAKGRDGR